MTAARVSARIWIMASKKGPSRPGSTNAEPLDDIDLLITKYVVRDPRAEVAEIADELRLSASGVQKRLSALFERKVLVREGIRVMSWPEVGFPLRYSISIEVDQRELRKGRGGPPDDELGIDSQRKLAVYIKDQLPKRFDGRIIVLEVTILLGEKADIVASVLARDHPAILEFVTDGLRILGGVSRTRTSEEAWSY